MTDSILCEYGAVFGRDASRRRPTSAISFDMGPAYTDRLCRLIADHFDLDTNDRLCFAGQDAEAAAVIPWLVQKFCLTEKVANLVLPTGDDGKTRNGSPETLPGVDAFFGRDLDASSTRPQFTKVILKDAVQFLDGCPSALQRIVRSMTDNGRLLIVHRCARTNTLPLHSAAARRMDELDVPLQRIVSSARDCGLDDVRWRLERLTCVMPKERWIQMMDEQFPLAFDGSFEPRVRQGVRELETGVLRYAAGDIEFTDRLVFLSASRTGWNKKQRAGGMAGPSSTLVVDPKRVNKTAANRKIQMPVTEDMDKCLTELKKKS